MSQTNALAIIRRLSTAAISISKAKIQLRSEFDPDKSLEMLSALSKQYDSPLASRYAQDLTVRRLAMSKRFSDIVNLIESKKSDPSITNERFLCTLIRSYGIAKMFNRALSTYEEMDKLGTPRTTFSFNSLLSSSILSGEFQKVPQLFDEMSKRYGVVPDSVSYGILAKSHCHAGNPEKALEILNEAGCATMVSYTTVLDALYGKWNKDEAEKLWSLMKEKNCVDVTAFNVKLKYLSEPHEMKKFIDEMGEAGFVPDTVSYNCLMTCYLKRGMVKEGEEVYKELREKGLRPNAVTFRTLMSFLSKNGDFEGGYRVFKDSAKMRKIPEFNTTKALAEGLVKKGMKVEAKELVQTVKGMFPRNLLNAWAKVEESLNLGSENGEAQEDSVSKS